MKVKKFSENTNIFLFQIHAWKIRTHISLFFFSKLITHTILVSLLCPNTRSSLLLPSRSTHHAWPSYRLFIFRWCSSHIARPYTSIYLKRRINMCCIILKFSGTNFFLRQTKIEIHCTFFRGGDAIFIEEDDFFSKGLEIMFLK